MKNTPKIDLEHTHTRFISKRIDKTLNWLLTSRDVWKEKCLKAKLELKMRTLSVKRLQDGRNKWKDQSKQVAKVIQQMEDTREHYLKEIDNLKKVLNKKNDEIENLKKKVLIPSEELKPINHTFSISLVYQCIRMEKEAHLHYRGVSAVMKLWCADNKMSRAPSHETCIQWDLKVGLYKLQRAKAKDTPWCWMVDHVIGEGYMKCLAIIGVPLNSLQNKSDLTLSLQEMEPFGLVPMGSSTGEKVQAALIKISSETGIIPQAIVSDHGSDLLLGIKDYCRSNNGQTVELYDVCHKVAIELKKLLINDPSWTAFSTKAAETKRLLYSTQGVDFAPPNQRRKGRYMNVDILIGWANRILGQEEEIPKNVVEKLRWVWDEQEKITLWGQWVEIAKQSRNLIRQNGFHRSSSDLLKDRLIDLPMQEPSQLLLDRILTYISVESNKLENDSKMIGTTEPLESLFGYFKRVKNGVWDGQGGVGRLILSMASRVGEITEELVKNSLEYITVHGVNDWLKTCRV